MSWTRYYDPYFIILISLKFLIMHLVLCLTQHSCPMVAYKISVFRADITTKEVDCQGMIH